MVRLIVSFMALLLFSSQAYPLDYMWEKKFKEQMALAEKNDVHAQYEVGIMYLRGRGVTVDQGEAAGWLRKSAEQGYDKAQYKLGMLYYQGKGMRRNYDQAHAWLQKSAAQKHHPAQFQLGEMYAQGQGVPQNYEQALSWYTMAANNGNFKAKDSIKEVQAAIAEMKQAEAKAAAAALPPPTARAKPSKAPARAEPSPTKVAKAKPTARKPEPAPVQRPKAAMASDTAATETKPVKAQPEKLAKADPREQLLGGSWEKDERPAIYLPSSINKCAMSTQGLACQTRDLSRASGRGIITYRVESAIDDFNENGTFTVVYANNVLAFKQVQRAEDEEPTLQNAPVKLGKQSTEHRLECRLEDKNSVLCVKDKTRKYQYTRKDQMAMQGR